MNIYQQVYDRLGEALGRLLQQCPGLQSFTYSEVVWEVSYIPQEGFRLTGMGTKLSGIDKLEGFAKHWKAIEEATQNAYASQQKLLVQIRGQMDKVMGSTPKGPVPLTPLDRA